MAKLKIGSLFAGYGGLDMAIHEVLDAETAWFCEFDEAPSKILAHHWPEVPNLGDVTKIDWETVPPVDIIAGGSPCQDLSQAGKRAGMTEGTRSNLWVNMREAIRVVRPRLVVWENVRGALSATATSESDMEQPEGLLGKRGSGHLRALGRVLGDLTDLGYDARWTTVRASDVGAPHHRARVFLVAISANPDIFGPQAGHEYPGEYGKEISVAHCGGKAFPHPIDKRRIRRGSTSEQEESQRTHGEPSGCSSRVHWGEYAPAVRRWERIVGPAPAPTEPNSKGKPRLNTAFAEWMMGLPVGHVTAPEIGLTRARQLKALGNGVVPQQGAAALRMLLGDVDAAS